MSLFALDRNKGEALYRQIGKALEREILQFYVPGACLPSEQELAQRFSVNRHTLRRAVDDLVLAGLLERRHGKGTFVLAPLDYAVGKGTRFTETLEALGRTTDSRVLRKLIVPARGGVADRLRLSPDEPVVWLETLRLVDQRPFCLISHFLPQRLVGGLYQDYRGGSLHELITRQYRIPLRRTESLVSASLPQGDDASLLAMPQNQPVLRVKSVNVDDRDCTPVEYALTRFRADRVQLCINP